MRAQSPLIKTLEWDFINAKGDVIYTTQDKQPTYTFPDSGLYQIKLSINKGDLCSDTSTTTAKSLPWFFSPILILMAYASANKHSFWSVYFTNMAKWIHGIGTLVTQEPWMIFSQQNPNYTYKIAGNKKCEVCCDRHKKAV